VRRGAIWIAAALGLLIAQPVHAAPQQTGARTGGEALTVQQVERMWDDYVLTQAQTTLNLTPQQFPRFRNRMLALQQVRRRMQRERNVVLREAQQLMAGRGPVEDPAAVTAKLKLYDDLMVRSADQLRQAYASIDELLNVRQRVRFRVFEERMAQKKLELLAQARQAARTPDEGRREPR
jgi:hypothetical protein